MTRCSSMTGSQCMVGLLMVLCMASPWLTGIAPRASAAPISLHDRGPCADSADGVCVPNRRNFGFYRTRWRPWPGEESAPQPVEEEAGPPKLPTDVPPFETPRPEDEEDFGQPGAVQSPPRQQPAEEPDASEEDAAPRPPAENEDAAPAPPFSEKQGRNDRRGPQLTPELQLAWRHIKPQPARARAQRKAKEHAVDSTSGWQNPLRPTGSLPRAAATAPAPSSKAGVIQASFHHMPSSTGNQLPRQEAPMRTNPLRR